MRMYSKMEGAELLAKRNIHPCLYDRSSHTPFDAHYFYQDIWAFKKILKTGTDSHVDVGSRTIFVGMVSAITNVSFIDIRTINVNLNRFLSKTGSILEMPYPANSVHSLSCLHVAEHVGLGRYGDRLDPKGTEKGTRELTRILAVGGNLYFSVPVGKPRVCFNAHRIHSPQQIIDYFGRLNLVEFSGVDDSGNYLTDIKPIDLENENYGCGFFHFSKM